MKLKAKVVLVTGAAMGIGAAIAEAFAKEGANVVINYRKSKAEAEKVFDNAKASGRKHLLIQADVGKSEDVKRMFAEINKEYGKLDILVNCAGDSSAVDFFESEPEEWEHFMTNNFVSTVQCSQEFTKMQGNSKPRKIINISSVYSFAQECGIDYGAYGASKAAINHFTLISAKQLAPEILVNAIAPGYVLTPHWGKMTEDEVKENGDEQLIKRFITAEEIADGAIFLAKNDSMTGTVLLMDGGLSLKSV